MSASDLHAAWNRITGQSLPMGVCSFEFEHGYYEFEKAGYNEKDLMTVVRYLQGEIRKGGRKPAALRWRNCVGDLLRFAEELELARGALRQKPPPTPKDRVLAQARPVALPERAPANDSAKHVSVYIKALRDAAGGAQ